MNAVQKSLMWTFAILFLGWFILYNLFWEQFKRWILDETLHTLTSKDFIQDEIIHLINSNDSMLSLFKKK